MMESADADLATLWTLFDGTHCVLSRIANGWSVRVEQRGHVLREVRVDTGEAALDVADRLKLELTASVPAPRANR